MRLYLVQSVGQIDCPVYLNIIVLEGVDFIAPFESKKDGELIGMFFAICYSSIILLSRTLNIYRHRNQYGTLFCAKVRP